MYREGEIHRLNDGWKKITDMCRAMVRCGTADEVM